MIELIDTKYTVHYTAMFKRQYKKALKQGKDEKKLLDILILLANGDELEPKYRNHKLSNDKKYKDCFECHIEPDWLLVYKYTEGNLVLLLFNLGSHSELFDM